MGLVVVASQWNLAGNHQFFFLWISIKQKHHLRECTQLKEKVRILPNENRKVLLEQAGMQVSRGEEKRFCEEASKNICASSAKEQQVG